MFEKLFRAGSSVAEIDVQEAKRRQDAGALLVDVRELHEWQEGHAREHATFHWATSIDAWATSPRTARCC